MLSGIIDQNGADRLISAHGLREAQEFSTMHETNLLSQVVHQMVAETAGVPFRWSPHL